MTDNYNFKCATLRQNKTSALLLCNVTKTVQCVNSENKCEIHRTRAVIETMILEGLVKRTLVVLFDITVKMGDGANLRYVHPDFRPFLICAVETLQPDGLSVFVIYHFHDLFVNHVVHGIIPRRGLRRGETPMGHDNGLHCLAVPGLHVRGTEVTGRREIFDLMKLVGVRAVVHVGEITKDRIATRSENVS